MDGTKDKKKIKLRCNAMRWWWIVCVFHREQRKRRAILEPSSIVWHFERWHSFFLIEHSFAKMSLLFCMHLICDTVFCYSISCSLLTFCSRSSSDSHTDRPMNRQKCDTFSIIICSQFEHEKRTILMASDRQMDAETISTYRRTVAMHETLFQ